MGMRMGVSMEIGLKEAFGNKIMERMITTNHPGVLRRRTREQGPWSLQNQASHWRYRATEAETVIQGPLWT